MPPLPEGPLLVRAVVIAIGLASAPALAADAPETGIHAVDETWMEVVGVSVAETADDALAGARGLAAHTIVESLRDALGGTHATHCLPAAHEHHEVIAAMLAEGGLPWVETEATVTAVDEGHRAVVRYHLPQTWWQARRTGLTTEQTYGRVLLCEGLLGEVRVVHDPAGFLQPGDTVLEVEGQRVRGLAELPVPTKRQRQKGLWATLRYQGVQDLIHAPPQPERIAPTCGPCCHGGGPGCKDYMP